MMKVKKLPLILTLICVWVAILGIAIDAYSPPAADSAKIAEQVSMTDGILGVQFYVEKGANVNAANLSLKVTYGAETVTLTMPDKAEARENCYVFTFEGVLPHGMGNDISAALYIGESVIPADTVSGTSYADGLKAIYAASESATEQQLIVDILEYGAAAQTYTGYRTNALVTKDFAPADEDEDLTPPDTDFVFSAGNVIDICSATVRFDSAVTLKVTYESDGESADVNGQTVAVDSVADVQGRKVVLYPVLPIHFHKKQDFGFPDGNYGGYTFSYSVNDYCYAMWENGSEGMKALARALYNYGLSAHLHHGVHDYSAGICLACGAACRHEAKTTSGTCSCGIYLHAAGNCGRNVVYRLEESGKLLIIGTGNMDAGQINTGVNSIVEQVTVCEGVTSVGAFALKGFNALTAVSLPEGLTSIGYEAFQGCTALTSLTVPASVESIGEKAFYNCYSLTALEIPASVTKVGRGAFALCTKLQDLTVAAGNEIYTAENGVLYEKSETDVTLLAAPAFSGALEIPHDVTAIGRFAFEGNVTLTDVTIPASVSIIEAHAFTGCRGITSLTIPASVKTVEDGAFLGCSNIQSLTLSEGITFLGISAFSGCTDLTHLTVPVSITTIDTNAFYECDALTAVSAPCSWNEGALYTFGNGVTVTVPSHTYTPEGGAICTVCGNRCAHTAVSAYNNCETCGVAISESGTCGTGVVYRLENDGTLVISGSGAMSDAVVPVTSANVKQLVVQKGVTGIGAGAFESFGNLTAVSLPEGLKSIGKNAFHGTALEELTIPASVNTIGTDAFAECNALAEVHVPCRWENWGDLYDFDSKVYVNAHHYVNGRCAVCKVTDCAHPAYRDGACMICGFNCGHPAYEDGFCTICGLACAHDRYYGGVCTACGTACEHEDYENGACAECGTACEHGAYKNGACTTCGTACKHPSYQDAACTVCGTACEHPSYNNGVCTVCRDICPHTEVSEAPGYCNDCDAYITAAGNCGADGANVVYRLDESGTLVISGTGAMADTSFSEVFLNSQDVKRITVKKGVTSIGNMAFLNLDHVTAVTLPEGLVSIGDWAFSSCQQLQTLDIPASVTTIGDQAFFSCYALQTLDIPASVTTIGSGAFYDCTASITVDGENTHYKVENDILYTMDGKTLVWVRDPDSFESFVVPTGVTAIGDYAFDPHMESQMTTLILPEGLVSIGEKAFYGCSKLTELTIPASVTTIGGNAFSLCNGLTTLTVNMQNGTIGSYAFWKCDRLTTVTLSAGVKEIDRYAFYSCTALKTVNVPCSWQEKPLYTFDNGVTVNIAEHSYTDGACTACGTEEPAA